MQMAGENTMTQSVTASQLQTLKALLHARRKELETQMAQNRANLAPAENTAGSVSQDENARLANQRREVDTRLTALDVQELARIDRALETLENGSYGLCEECGCAIPFERLKIEPMTQHCVKCKSKWEQAHPQATRIG
jgi:DnaK suppressor protein